MMHLVSHGRLDLHGRGIERRLRGVGPSAVLNFHGATRHGLVLVDPLDPSVTVELAGRGAKLSVKLKNLRENGSRTRGDMVRDDEVALHDFLVEVLIILAPEGEAATEKGKEQDSTGPNVGRRTTELFLCDNLRCHVTRGATEDLDFLVIWNAGTEAKVNDLDVSLRI